jgi:inosine-uridine nucleoside N-ribohydrolase
LKHDRRDFLKASGAGLLAPYLLPVTTDGADPTANTNKAPRASLGPRPLIIDTDPGVDDAVSILLAFRSSEVSIDAITVVAGNVEAEYGTRNALSLVEYGNRLDIPVALGAIRPLMRTQLTVRLAHGKNGFGDVTIPQTRAKLVPQHAADLIIERVQSKPNQYTILAIGPLTNLALAFLKEPSIAPLVAEVCFMGGTVLSNGNTTPVATFNIFADPEAAKIVVNSGVPRITMIGTDVTTRVQFIPEDFDHLESSGTSFGHLASQLGGFRIRRFPIDQNTTPKVGFNDLSTTVAVVNPSLFKFEAMKVDIETRGELTTGMTVANRRNRIEKIEPEGDHEGIVGTTPVQPNVQVCTDISADAVKQLFLQRLSSK